MLLPLAEQGHTVVIAKQPLGIAFLALGAFDTARARHPAVTGWVVGDDDARVRISETSAAFVAALSG